MTEINQSLSQTISALNELKQHINQILIGQSEVVEQVLVAILSSGHVLIEGVPGLGKTLLVETLASGIGCDYKRIQFTPDLMPGDVTGHYMFNMGKSEFVLKKGPVFTNLLLADEINRAPAKTQAALLEVMQENQVTLDGETLKVEPPFMVLGTQNPIDQEGTYNLPEAELDRFIMKIKITYPSHEEEVKLALSNTNESRKGKLLENLNVLDIKLAQEECTKIVVDQKVADYAVKLVRETRKSSLLRLGAGPRASIALIKCAKGFALMNGQTYITPDDIKAIAIPVLRHRVSLSPEVEIDGLSTDDVLNSLIEKVAAPRS